MAQYSGSWQFWIDRGGTFTDVLAVSPDGELSIRKLLSENPSQYPDAALHAVRETMAAAGVNASIACLKIGTTIGTNALLERKGAPVLFITTKGFADAAKIGYQNRPHIFARHIKRQPIIYEAVIEADERIGAHGNIVRQLDLDRIKSDLTEAATRGFQSCAITFMHGYRYPEHEKSVAKLAHEAGFTQVSVSHAISPLIKFIDRAHTTLVDAYLSPLLKKYVEQFQKAVPGTPIFFMQSNGGLAEASSFLGKDSILSGPAGGVIAAAKTAESCGFNKIISFDMGGTSTDVSHINGELEYLLDAEVAGIRLRTPLLDIHTVAAGGGSILSFDGAALKVGPHSAGAKPGPLCYRNGGPLTITDANLLLGKLHTEDFPHIFGISGKEPLDLESVSTAFEKLAHTVSISSQTFFSKELLAEGYIEIAVTKMANAIKHISTQRGHELTDYTLCSFGGAGGQHACLIAEALGIKNVLIHPCAGLLSAYGIGIADSSKIDVLDINEELSKVDFINLESRIAGYIDRCRKNLPEILLPTLNFKITTYVRYEGSDFSLSVPWGTAEKIAATFREKHLARYGFSCENKVLTLESTSIKITWQPVPIKQIKIKPSNKSGSALRSKIFSRQKWHDCLVIRRDSLLQEQSLNGPALIVEDNATTVIEPGWKVKVLTDYSLLLSHIANDIVPAASPETTIQADPVKLEFFSNLFMFIAEQMGFTLQNTSHSVNIKERLDFSCAIFNQEGELIANAPHIPVHLGSMGDSVQSLIRANKQMSPGDAFASNNPFDGGTHLPDITVISPVFDPSGKEILFYVASRGHHADVGGISPGSMPSNSKSIIEEGVILDNFQLIKNHLLLEEEMKITLANATYPARNPEQNLADLKAQIAANAKGTQELQKSIQRWGKECIHTYMDYILDHAEECIRQAIASLTPGEYCCRMDDGATIQVSIKINHSQRCAVIDFTGSSSQQPSNLNAPLSVCKAAVLYVFRTLTDMEIPLNAGCFRPLEIIVPKQSILNPEYPAAVVAGNVETSQVVVDAIYAALGKMAASQGTMNNFTFGNDEFQYYETICGGSGAGPDFAGTDAVHSHMTNSRLTDHEILESRFPVRVEHFKIRTDSGGSGNYAGGNGVSRKIKFLEPATAVILSDRRQVEPHGLAGGKPGLTGRNRLISVKNGERDLGGRACLDLEAEDAILIETPGGGGFGASTLDV